MEQAVHRIGPALAALIAALAVPAAWAATPFGAPTPVAGVGAPQGAAFTSAATTADGTTLLTGTRSAGRAAQAFVAIGRDGRLPGRAVGMGPVGLITTAPQVVADDDGHAAIVFAVGMTVYLTICSDARCGPPVRVATSGLQPEAAVALKPGDGRTTVLWRGRTMSGANRLQWRITTGGRLGRLHTLGELGDAPRLGTDATGRTVAIWVRHAIRAGDPRGLRTAARHVGEFIRPTTVQTGAVRSPSIATGLDGETITAWLRGGDVENPSGQAFVATRTASRGLGSPVAVGGPDTGALALALAADGHAVLALDRQLDATTTVVDAARRAPHGGFGATQALSSPQFVPTVLGPAAAIDANGGATVAWSAPSAVRFGSAVTPIGSLAARADADSPFAAPQQLDSGASNASSGQRPVLAASGSRTVVAWTTRAAAMVAATGP